MCTLNPGSQHPKNLSLTDIQSINSEGALLGVHSLQTLYTSRLGSILKTLVLNDTLIITHTAEYNAVH